MKLDDFAAKDRSYTTQDAELPYADDFEREDNLARGETWTEQAGEFAVVLSDGQGSALSGNNKIGSMEYPSVATVNVVGALTFFPALALGPIVEHFLMLGS
mgnify:CR=1 FL=1